jgi:uncharacterized protein
MFFALCLTFFHHGTGYAASFDCAQASRPLEKTICADSELGKADEEMADHFLKKMDSLDSDRSRALLNEQGVWLKQRMDKCPTLDSFCLLKLYVDRINELRTRPPADFRSCKWKNISSHYNWPVSGTFRMAPDCPMDDAGMEFLFSGNVTVGGMLSMRKDEAHNYGETAIFWAEGRWLLPPELDGGGAMRSLRFADEDAALESFSVPHDIRKTTCWNVPAIVTIRAIRVVSRNNLEAGNYADEYRVLKTGKPELCYMQ